jgi:predicted 2-oxoglutarate/Fe(II)-dependent dioxygenase YbiX
MLRFANIILTNPAKPNAAPVEVRALVTEGDFGLAVDSQIVDKLELEQIDLREVSEAGKKSPCLVPYVGPVRVTCGGKDVFTGAANCISGVAIGAKIAKELKLDSDTTPGDRVESNFAVLSKSKKSGDDVNPLDKILIAEQAIDEDVCRRICEHVKSQKQQNKGVEVVSNSIMPGASTYKQVQSHARDSYVIKTQDINPLIREVYYGLITKYVMPFFGVKIESWERPQLLSYEKGGKYDPHADGELSVKKPGGKNVWRRFHNRDISLILYLNDEFTGGDLIFPDYGIRIKPKPGLFVAFPSTGDYLHGAEPTQSGDRIVMVTWASIEGTPRMIGEGADHVYLKSYENQE